MTQIGIVFHPERPQAREVVRRVLAWCHQRGCRAVCLSSDREWFAGFADVECEVTALDNLGDCDVVISVGGDGTVLRTVRELQGSPVPVLGINVGYLGYLIRVEPESALGFLDAWLDGQEGRDWFFDDRALVEGTVITETGRTRHSYLALNEMVMEKQEAGHTIRLDVAIDGAPFVTYSADGIIVATPTGSTAYSLSARGPVLSPRVKALLMTPVAPHMVFDRSLVLDPAEEIEVTVSGSRRVNVAIDGLPVGSLGEGDSVRLRGAQQFARFVRFENMRFHQILRTKFGLADL